MLTLFWTLTLVPSFVPGITTTFCPRLHRSPISAPAMTWQKCQTLVPRPMRAPSSTYADSCAAQPSGDGIICPCVGRAAVRSVSVDIARSQAASARRKASRTRGT